MYNEVLIPTDGSRGAQTAASHGLSIAKQYGATVHALHVVDKTTGEVPESSESIPESWVSAGDKATKRIADRAADGDPPVITEVRRGSPDDVILDYVDERGIDIIVLGTHGRTKLKKPLLGKVTKTVVRTANVPVLCVPPGDQDTEPTDASEVTYHSILVPTDGSKAAQNAVDHGLELARTYEAALHALYVVDRRAYASRPGRTWDDMKTTLEQSGKQITERVADAEAESGVPVVTAVRHGVPHQAIHDYADEQGVDLIAMGTHGKTGMANRVLGSDTERVLRLSEVPVFTAKTD